MEGLCIIFYIETFSLLLRNTYLFPDDSKELRTNERHRLSTGGRSAALEKAYVHDVYENCDESGGLGTSGVRPKISQFLAGLDPGSLVCDVGCGNGRYLTSCNPYIYSIGIDRCYRLTKLSRSKGGEVSEYIFCILQVICLRLTHFLFRLHFVII